MLYSEHCGGQLSWRIGYDTIEEFNVDSKAKYTTWSSIGSQKLSGICTNVSGRLSVNLGDHLYDLYVITWYTNIYCLLTMCAQQLLAHALLTEHRAVCQRYLGFAVVVCIWNQGTRNTSQITLGRMWSWLCSRGQPDSCYDWSSPVVLRCTYGGPLLMAAARRPPRKVSSAMRDQRDVCPLPVGSLGGPFGRRHWYDWAWRQRLPDPDRAPHRAARRPVLRAFDAGDDWRVVVIRMHDSSTSSPVRVQLKRPKIRAD